MHETELKRKKASHWKIKKKLIESWVWRSEMLGEKKKKVLCVYQFFLYTFQWGETSVSQYKALQNICHLYRGVTDELHQMHIITSSQDAEWLGYEPIEL